MERHNEDMYLWRRLDELDAELDASGVEDATSWEHWDEMENILMLLAERHVQRQKLDFDAEQLVELVDEMQEAALTELGAFGFIEPPNPFEEREPLNDAESAACYDCFTM